jgi:4-hydroxy-3-methylbut-2-enyl diphosphate reductase
VGNPVEADEAARQLKYRKDHARTVLIGQTTITPEEFEAIGRGIAKIYPDLKIIDTICGAVRERQDSLRELCAGVGGVIIAGGRQSANTRRLLDIAVSLGKPAWLAEGAEDIPGEIRDCGTAGLCAGASTPDGVIDEIERALENM